MLSCLGEEKEPLKVPCDLVNEASNPKCLSFERASGSIFFSNKVPLCIVMDLETEEERAERNRKNDS